VSWQCQCGVANKARAAFCEACGEDRKDSATRPEPRRVCPFDGATLNADGYCGIGDGYPITLKYCPDACPHCRKSLAWNGDCFACMPAGEKPGHLYDVINAHWRKTEKGPQPLAPPAVALESMRQIDSALVPFLNRTIKIARSDAHLDRGRPETALVSTLEEELSNDIPF